MLFNQKLSNFCRRLLLKMDDFLPVLPHMELKPNCGSARAWVWSTPADFADEEAKPELLAIRFANEESECCPFFVHVFLKE